MAKLVITGKKQYVKRLGKHLEKEHPSTKGRILIKTGQKEVIKMVTVSTRKKSTAKMVAKVARKKGLKATVFKKKKGYGVSKTR